MVIVGVVGLIYLWAIFAVIRDSYRKSRDKRRESKRIQKNYRLVESAEENTSAVLAELNALPDEKARIECLRRHSEKVFLTDSWYWMYIEPYSDYPEVQIIIIGSKDPESLMESIDVPESMAFGTLTLHTAGVRFGQRRVYLGSGRYMDIPESIDLAKASNTLQFKVPGKLWRGMSALKEFSKLKTFRVPELYTDPYCLISECKGLETVELSEEWPDLAISQCPKLRKLIFPSYQSFLDDYSSYQWSRMHDTDFPDKYEETMKALYETGVNPDSGIELSIEFSNGDSLSELHVPDPIKDRERYKWFEENAKEVLPNRVKSIVFPENAQATILTEQDSFDICLDGRDIKREFYWWISRSWYSSLESVTLPKEVWIEDWDADDGKAILSDWDDETPFVRLTPANVARYEKLLGIKINLKS